ncbi:hypothetical protein A3I57_01035 [Candidatus Beckwithbacteria bacterium RIFCSPLOWO2_02_FULL_47_23]|uniref:EamA domain-containing protein n=1 Tax=Candidatus Beckwithbacteria bacterium RIFCSPLOWO2_02_FULL_47_23 TaxID=1797463 RepID=A0A1F5DZE7_9BACT|nr:MAG: hypothetical protein A3I57_01035 [Candidatus Beckwithbacteria bacterium RIFCSPLOWO2_02_FULL_47_23]
MWLILALVTAVFWAVGQMPKQLVYLANAGYLWIFWLAVFLFKGGFEWDPTAAGLAIFPGLGFIYALVALSRAEAGLISAISAINPAITTILAVSFLGEKLNGFQGILIGIIVFGAIYMALPEKVKVKNTVWIWWGIGFGLLSGLNNFLSKIGLNRVNTLSYSLIVASWQLIAALVWMTASRSWGQLPRLLARADRVGVVGTGIFNLGSVAFFAALGLGQASLVMPVVNLYVPLICLLAWWWLKERMTRRQMAGAGVIVVSVILFSLIS